MRRIIFLLVNLAFITSCTNDPLSPDSDELEFVPGYVIIGINADVTIERVFGLINQHELSIDKMSGFFNYSTLPNDSLNFVTNYLKDKPYLNKRGFKGGSAFISKTDNRITVTEFLFEMDMSAQFDWLDTIDTLELKDLGNDTQNVTVLVDEGTEKFWASQFAEYPEVSWTELNWIVNIERH